jgi:hypothetical protein
MIEIVTLKCGISMYCGWLTIETILNVSWTLNEMDFEGMIPIFVL